MKKEMTMIDNETRVDTYTDSDGIVKFVPNMDILKDVYILFAMPCYGGNVSEATFTSFMRWTFFANQFGIKWNTFTLANESLITRARNTCVDHFKKNESYTHLFFVDADIGFDPWEACMLIQSGYPLVGGGYPLKKFPVEVVANRVENPIETESHIEVSRTGTGFLCIERSVFDVVEQHESVRDFKSDAYDMMGYPLKTWFDCDIRNDTYLSEDWFFCENYREMGGRVFLDKRFDLTHQGMIAFSQEKSDQIKDSFEAMYAKT